MYSRNKETLKEIFLVSFVLVVFNSFNITIISIWHPNEI